MNMHVVQLVLHGLDENSVEQLSRSACVRVRHSIVHALSGLFASEDEVVPSVPPRTCSCLSRSHWRGQRGRPGVPFFWLALRP